MKRKMSLAIIRNQRGATAVTPYSVRARENVRVACPIAREELPAPDGASRWHLGDAELINRAASKHLIGWGLADQVLPDL